ncbi:MAG: carboxypeptidase-like regulatory domain-containing protein, partial [Planctomycetota bacterium]
ILNDERGGRPSVTVTTCGIRHPLVWWMEPRAEVRGGVWGWTASEGPAVGRLNVGRAPSAHARMAVEPRDVDGSQVLSWWQRTGRCTDAALVLETETGGRFGFGDSGALDAIEREGGPLTARAVMMRPKVSASRGVGSGGVLGWLMPRRSGWRRMSCPLWNLRWPAGTDARGTPMPSHRPVAVELWVVPDGLGGPRPWAEVAEIELGRPRTTRSRRGDAGAIVLGGWLASRAAGVPVELLDARTGAVMETVSEGDGRFRFTRARPGAYRLRAVRTGDVATPKRGGGRAAFEALTSRFDLVLDDS